MVAWCSKELERRVASLAFQLVIAPTDASGEPNNLTGAASRFSYPHIAVDVRTPDTPVDAGSTDLLTYASGYKVHAAAGWRFRA